ARQLLLGVLPAQCVAVAVLVDDAALGGDQHRGRGEAGRSVVQPSLDDPGQTLEHLSVQTGGVVRGPAQGAARGAGAAPVVALLGSVYAGGSGSFRARCGLRGGTAGSGLPAGGIAVPVGRGQPHGGGGRGESGAGQGGSSGQATVHCGSSWSYRPGREQHRPASPGSCVARKAHAPPTGGPFAAPTP